MKKPLVITIVVLVVLLGGCAGCVTLAYKTFTQTMAQVDPLADRFVALWNARDVDGLYALCGSHGDKAAFAARANPLIEATGALSQRTMQGFNANATTTGTSAVVAYHVRGERVGGVLRLTLERERDTWSLTDFSFEADHAAPPAEKPRGVAI